MDGTSLNLHQTLLHFTIWNSELSVLDACLLLGSRVIIPAAGHQIILNQLHQTHPGITKMKILAPSYVWWPGIDADIKITVQDCNTCQLNRSDQQKHHSISGNFHKNHRVVFTSTMLGHF